MISELSLSRKLFFCMLLSIAAVAQAAAAAPTVVLNGGSADEAEVRSDDTVFARGSGFLFPNHIGDMPLRKVQVYGRSDVSVDYSLRGGGNGDAWITLFVYPAAQPFADEVSDIRHDLTQAWSATPIAPMGTAPAAASDGSSAWYTGNFKGVAAKTGYVVVQRGPWFIEARYTVPDVAGQDGIDRTLRALDAIPWNWRAGAARTPAVTPALNSAAVDGPPSRKGS